MITNKDIRVENGSLIINGDPYPLDGQSPEAIMEIVEDNSDTTPTENSDAPITSGGVYTALGTKQDTLTFDTVPTENSTNPVESGGVYAALAGLLKYKDVTVKSDSTGHAAPVQSSGGAYYEQLVTYESIGVTAADVLSIMPVDWSNLQKEFTIYRGNISISALSDSSASIYKDNTASLVLRVVYKG
jgi:hypothetical protein